jgi:hypothetical protein
LLSADKLVALDLLQSGESELMKSL